MRTLALIALACAAEAGVHPAVAQVTASVEAGVSEVRYDGFLASAAGSVSPTFRWEHPGGRGFLSARGTYLHFESGRHSLDGSTTGSWLLPLARRWRAELGLAAGSSQYANIASFSHLETEVRVHLMDGDRGGWLGATAGRSWFAGLPRRVAVVATGFWLLRHDKTIFVSLDRSFVGDTAYSDLRASGRWNRRKITLEGIVGARVWSRGGGRGVFGEGSAAVPLAPGAALVVSAGRYPTDAVSGSISGRYVTVAIRLGTISVHKPPAPALPGATAMSGSASTVPAIGGEARLEIQDLTGDSVLLVLHTSEATSVEISGDFTDWRPVLLTRMASSSDAWAGTFRITPGIHRVNVRRDNGPWIAPAGTRHVTDDYEGEVGVFILP